MADEFISKETKAVNSVKVQVYVALALDVVLAVGLAMFFLLGQQERAHSFQTSFDAVADHTIYPCKPYQANFWDHLSSRFSVLAFPKLCACVCLFASALSAI